MIWKRCIPLMCGVISAVVQAVVRLVRLANTKHQFPHNRSRRYGERETFLRIFFTVGQVEGCLNRELALQGSEAKAKLNEPLYWRSTGQVELRAIFEMQDIIASLSDTSHAGHFAASCYSALQVLLEKWRADNIGDPDGFGVATIHAVRQSLESPPNSGSYS